MLNLFKRLFREEEGQGLVEYGLIIALVALVIIGALRLIGTNLTGVFNSIASKIVTP